MADKFEPKIIAFTCTWCGYPSASMAGVNKIEYPPNVSVVRVMCSGSVEPGVIMDAFEHGADGIIIIGCLIDNCHYVGLAIVITTLATNVVGDTLRDKLDPKLKRQ